MRTAFYLSPPVEEEYVHAVVPFFCDEFHPAKTQIDISKHPNLYTARDESPAPDSPGDSVSPLKLKACA